MYIRMSGLLRGETAAVAAVGCGGLRGEHLSEGKKKMTAGERIEASGLLVDGQLYRLVQDEIAPGTGVEPGNFWESLAKIVADLGGRNRQLLDQRDTFQQQIDEWHQAHGGGGFDGQEVQDFLSEIGYLVEETEDFEIATQNVDPEIASIAGPQLVVPVDNARYCLNAANARWGSLYDALYGTDVIPRADSESASGYDPVRGARVIARSEEILDQHVGLAEGSYADVVEFRLEESDGGRQLVLQMSAGAVTGLADRSRFAGYQETDGRLSGVLLRHQGLHIEIQLDREHPVGKDHPAGVKDVVIEAAVTTIQDCEDSVSAVDAADKVLVYRNWLGLMKGDLEVEFEKGGETLTRRLNPDREYTTPAGESLVLPGRSLLLVRNVGPHMYTDAVTTAGGDEIPEGFLDAMVTSLAAMHDLQGNGTCRNSRTGSMYIVKPKQHGPDEVAATVELFGRVEEALSLPRNTLKIGIMDEERRTSVNLVACIAASRERVVFINTGFLDRTGDEIHTLMEAGPVIPKPEVKDATWLSSYEDNNVDAGLATGFRGRAQIGKGMWAMPDLMAAMVESKGGQPRAGANTAWVPSPTAAVLHALHYHETNVAERQDELADRPAVSLADVLTPCLLGDRKLGDEEIQRELDNNVQGILGYVVRWIDQGVGCSKVPDINDVGLMEDRATLRISSQHIANWLHHRVVSAEDVRATFERMAAVVDGQNAEDPLYRPMAPGLDGTAYQAALALVFEGHDEPNGYTERVLTTSRRRVKRGLADESL